MNYPRCRPSMGFPPSGVPDQSTPIKRIADQTDPGMYAAAAVLTGDSPWFRLAGGFGQLSVSDV